MLHPYATRGKDGLEIGGWVCLRRSKRSAILLRFGANLVFGRPELFEALYKMGCVSPRFTSAYPNEFTGLEFSKDAKACGGLHAQRIASPGA